MRDLLNTLSATGDALLNAPVDVVSRLLSGDAPGALAELIKSVGSVL